MSCRENVELVVLVQMFPLNFYVEIDTVNADNP